MKKLFAISLAAAFLVPASSALAVPTKLPDGAKWSQATITEPDGTKLHADILRPAHLPDDAKTPVIVSIGPYFNHSGQEERRRTTTSRSTRPKARRTASWTSSRAAGSCSAATPS